MSKIHYSPTLYPIFTMYLAGVGVAIGIAMTWVGVDAGLIVLSAIAAMLVLMALTREVKIVHTLVNGQRDELLGRIDTLTKALENARVAVPKEELP